MVQKTARRGITLDMSEFLRLAEDRRLRLQRIERLRHELNQASRQIGILKKQGKDASRQISEMKAVSRSVKQEDDGLRETEQLMRTFLMAIPNLVHDSVPVGEGSGDNREVRCWGTPPAFDSPPRPHWEIGTELGILDFERAAKLAGARFTVYSGAGARLERALINLMLDMHTLEKGYREVLPPFIANSESLTGTGNLPKFEEDLFKLRGRDWYLIPTAEVPLTNLHRGEILDGSLLPCRYAAYTPCFRSEAGSYGKDIRGLIRQHQFNKVEMMSFVTPETSFEELEFLTGNAEAVLQRLELPYRVMELCTGDLGFSGTKTYDLEVWMPNRDGYVEISSCSNCGDFQARRADIRFKRDRGARPEFVHTLNGSGLAVGRTVGALLECFQQPDGSVTVPRALRPYLGGMERINGRPEK